MRRQQKENQHLWIKQMPNMRNLGERCMELKKLKTFQQAWNKWETLEFKGQVWCQVIQRLISRKLTSEISISNISMNYELINFNLKQ